MWLCGYVATWPSGYVAKWFSLPFNIPTPPPLPVHVPTTLEHACLKKLVGCRGGSRNVEGHWGFPCLKIEKFAGFAKFPFHVFDRYEIHIQYFEEMCKDHFLVQMFGSSSFHISKVQKLQITNFIFQLRISKFQNFNHK